MPTKRQLADLKREAAALVREGFPTRAEIVSLLRGWGESYGHPDAVTVRRVVAGAILAHHRRQAKWTRPTDCDKLDVAFDALTRSGVIACQDFTDCSADGHQLLRDEVKSTSPSEVIGYAFYHMQATLNAIESGHLHIKYDARENHRGKRRRIGQKVVDALTAAGLKTEWNSDPDTAVRVILKWQKRRKDRLPKRK